MWRSMLMAAHGHDLIADYQFGLRRGICNLLGLNVNLDQFVGDLIAGHFSDLESTLEDLRLLRAPLCIATSPATSTALPPADLPHAFMTALGAHSKLVNISTPLTEGDLNVQGSPPAAFKQLLKQIASVLPATIHLNRRSSAQPYVARQRRIEQEYTLLRHDASQINREALCAAHLSQLPQMGNLHEYRKLLDDLYGLMSPLNPGAVLVDAGHRAKRLDACGTGQSHVSRRTCELDRPAAPLMVGVGRDGEGSGRRAMPYASYNVNWPLALLAGYRQCPRSPSAGFKPIGRIRFRSGPARWIDWCAIFRYHTCIPPLPRCGNGIVCCTPRAPSLSRHSMPRLISPPSSDGTSDKRIRTNSVPRLSRSFTICPSP